MIKRLPFVFVAIIILHIFVDSKPLENVGNNLKCGYASCNKAKPNTLNVHLVPHSHDDVGWLKTVDQYFTGARTEIQRADVSRIITSVVKALQENPERRFIQVETAFFHKWWSLQNNETRDVVRNLVNNGQLEFAGGGWSMNDEAAVHYHSIIDQFSLGLRFLYETFGTCGRPKVGWQIDPFGHSNEMASIFAQLGFDGLFFARLDWRDKSKRLGDKNAEMIWQGSESLGEASRIFTSVLYNHYSSPQGFCFDINCNDNPMIADKTSTEYNFKEKILQFTRFVSEQARHYQTNNILVTMGDDFHYQDALNNYRNLDTLIEGFKIWRQEYLGMEINVFYSTPACYAKSVNEAINEEAFELPLEVHDFLPYASDPHTYWSGYFTSRPASKRSERKLNNLMQAHKHIASFHNDTIDKDEIFPIQNAVAIMQHHDAITGTEKQHVANDYARIMHSAFEDSATKLGKRLSKMLNKNKTQQIDLKLKQCILKNITICNESDSDEFVIVAYNPLSRNVSYPIRIPVNSIDFEIIGPNDTIIRYQVNPSLVRDKQNSAKFELTFIGDLPSMGAKVFYLRKLTKRFNSIHIDNTRTRYFLGRNSSSLSINPSTGRIDSMTINGIAMNTTQQLLYYKSAQGNNAQFAFRASGAYIFRNNGSAQNITESFLKFDVYKGELFDEVQQEFASWAKQAVRVYHNSNHIEFDWYIGPIPVEDHQGKEVISRYSFNLTSDNVFYTDSNGREMIRRKRNFRSTYEYTNEEPIAGNYYPVDSQITITNGFHRVSVLNDRSQSGTSLSSGTLELLVHRRMLYDDAFGVGEALNEMENGQGLKVRGKHFLTFTKPDSQHLERKLAEELSNSPIIFLSNSVPFHELKSSINWEFAGIRKQLPKGLKVLTLEPIPTKKNLLILRLENMYDSQIGSQISIDVKDLFASFDINSITETYLGADAKKDETQRLVWRQQYMKSKSRNTKEIDEIFIITLAPMEIKTFIIGVIYKV